MLPVAKNATESAIVQLCVVRELILRAMGSQEEGTEKRKKKKKKTQQTKAHVFGMNGIQWDSAEICVCARRDMSYDSYSAILNSPAKHSFYMVL